MSVQTKITFRNKLLSSAPLILLYVSVLNEFDFNYLNYKYFSFNFPIGIPALNIPPDPEV